MTHRQRHNDFDFDEELLRLLEEDRSRHSWALVSIARSLRELVEEVAGIRVILLQEFAPQISSTRITLMPKSIVVGSTATAHITATKSDGTVFPITAGDTVALAASVPGDVSFGAPTFNADGSADIVVTGVNADAGDDITATVDGVTSAADTLTITAAPPATVTVTLQ